MEEKKLEVISKLNEYLSSPSKLTLEPLYRLYNEIFFFGWINYGLAKRKRYIDFKKRCGGGCDKEVMDSLRFFAGMPGDADKVQRQSYEERLAICKSCEHHKRYLGGIISCGTLFFGETLETGDKLCGCVMNAKCWFKSFKCSLNDPKWT